jgi:hypothetical protein
MQIDVHGRDALSERMYPSGASLPQPGIDRGCIARWVYIFAIPASSPHQGGTLTETDEVLFKDQL